MAHLRYREIHDLFLRKIKQWPAVCLLGPRQCGKSTFVKDLALKEGEFTQISFDKGAQRIAAKQNPEHFLKKLILEPIVLDEVQKIPELFDEIKALIDEERRPGRFILTGSARFSSKIGIRESLTGRTAVLYLDSLTLGETLRKTQNDAVVLGLTEISRYLQFGGMPVICFSRDDSVRRDYWDEWLETLCEQDLHAFSHGRLSSDLARQLLELSAQVDEPVVSEFAKKTGVNARRIQNHLEALENLFVLYRVEPHPQSVGKTRYLPFDCGLVHHFGGSEKRKWEVLFYHQIRNQLRFQGSKKTVLQYLRTKKGIQIDFVLPESNDFFQLVESTYPSQRQLQSAKAILTRLKPNRFVFVCATDEAMQTLSPRLEVWPLKQIF